MPKMDWVVLEYFSGVSSLGVLLFVMSNCFCHFPKWYLGSGMVLDCIDS